MTRTLALAAVVLIATAGCGAADGGQATEPTTEPATGPTTEASTEGAQQGGLSDEDVASIEDVLVTFDLEGGCGFMTDRFLEEQTFIDDRERACAAHEAAIAPKSYTAEDIIISDISGKSERAQATLGSEIADLTVAFQLVERDGTWLIDGFEL